MTDMDPEMRRFSQGCAVLFLLGIAVLGIAVVIALVRWLL